MKAELRDWVFGGRLVYYSKPHNVVVPGELFAERYRIDSRLGQGGMGAVYSALDTWEDRACAIKIFDDHFSTAGDRFKREFRAAARLNHPHCVHVYDFGNLDGSWFLTMELMAGGDLEKWHGASTDAIVGVALQALAALDCLHAKHLIHRDIKPQNILLGTSSAGSPAWPLTKLCDFGIAKLGDVDHDFELGSVLGSVRYIAPEQLEGAADPRSDLYGLGAVLYRLLARRIAFEAPRAPLSQLIEWRRSLVIPPLAQVAPTVPPGLAAAVMRLLEYDPNRRFSTAAGAYDALVACLERPESRAGLSHPPLARSDYLAPPRFAGRKSEMRNVRQFLQEAFASERQPPVALFVSGEAGVGKSRVAAYFLRVAASFDAHVEVGTCRAQAGAPYEPVAALLRMGSSHGRAPLSESEKFGGGIAAPRSQTEGATHSTLAAQREGLRWELQHRVASALLDLAGRKPLVVILEDVQWADTATLELLAAILRSVANHRQRGRSPRLAFLLTHRVVTDSIALTRLQEQASTLGLSRTIPLAPLEDHAAVDLVSSMLMTDVTAELENFAHRLAKAAGGNPLFITQILHYLLERGRLRRIQGSWNMSQELADEVSLPGSVHGAIGDRSARLPLATKRVLAAASVIGRRFNLPALEKVLGVEEALVLDALDEAMRGGFVEEQHSTYVFAHDHIREAIYNHLEAEPRRLLHEATAKALQHHSESAEAMASDIAHHYREAQCHEQAFHFSMLACQRAFRAYAFDDAVRMYEHAQSVASAAGIAVSSDNAEMHADACVQIGRFDDATKLYERILEDVASPLRRIDILRKRAELDYRRGNNAGAAPPLEEVLRLLNFSPPAGHLTLSLRLIGHASVLAMYTLVPSLLRKQSTKTSRRDELLCSVCSVLLQVYYFRDFTRSVFYALASLTTAARLGPHRVASYAFATGGAMMALLGLYGVGERYFVWAFRAAEQSNAAAERGWVMVMRSLALLCEGEIKASLEAALEAERRLKHAREPLFLRSALEFRAEAALALGETAMAKQAADLLSQISEELNELQGRGWAQYLLGHISARQGDPERAMALLKGAVDNLSQAGDITYRIVAGARLAFEEAMFGHADTALARAVVDSEECRRLQLRVQTAVTDGVLLASAALMMRAGRPISSEHHAEVSRARKSGKARARTLRYGLPLFLAGAAAWDLANGRQQEGQKGFSQACDIAVRQGMLGELYDIRRLAAIVDDTDPLHQTEVERLSIHLCEGSEDGQGTS